MIVPGFTPPICVPVGNITFPFKEEIRASPIYIVFAPKCPSTTYILLKRFV